LEKNTDFSQNENIFVKKGKLFTHLKKNILILRKCGEKNPYFSQKFPMIFASEYL